MYRSNEDEKMNSQESSPVYNPHSVEEARNQTTMTPKNQFPWTTVIIALILFSIVCAIVLLARA